MSAMPGPDGEFDKALVVDFGAQYAQLIARRVREANVYSEIISPCCTAAEIAAKAPAGIIFSGGPDSVHADGAIAIDPAVDDLDIPILGICHGAADRPAERRHSRPHRSGRAWPHVLTVEGDGGTPLSGTPTSRTSGCRISTPSPCRRTVSRPRHPPPTPSSLRSSRPNASSTACSSTRKRALPSSQQVIERSFAAVWHAGRLDRGLNHRHLGRADPPAGRRQAGHLCAVRWCRFRGCRCAQGHRRSAHLCACRYRPDAPERGRPGHRDCSRRTSVCG